MELDQVLIRLKKALNGPLPGMAGQMRMAPLPMDEDRFRSPNESMRKSAVLLLLCPSDEGCIVPFIKRPVYPGIHSGQISLPGGKWEPSDADLVETALRETHEEIGIAAADVTVMGRLSPLFIPPSNFTVTPYVGYTEQVPDFKPSPREVERVITCRFARLVEKDIRKQGEIAVGARKIVAPYFDIQEEIVWGATAMILSELLYLWERLDEMKK